MRWPFTHYGTGTLFGVSGFFLALWALGETVSGIGSWMLVLLGLTGLAGTLWFFRDPERRASGGDLDLVSPADGMVSDLVTVEDPDLGGTALRVGIFLSVVDVHVNRVPCAGTVTARNRRQGKFLDARDPRCIDENQAATIVLRRGDGRSIGVRQITGLIARRIVCPVEVGDHFERAERYGMIQFGSRTELLVHQVDVADVKVRVGERVKGGETLLLAMHPVGGVPTGA